MKRALVVLALCAGSVWLLLLASYSLRWRTQHDAPLMLYVAWMMDAHGAVPYRDILDMNLPGTYFANLVIGRLSGYSDLGVRIADLSILGGVLAATFLAMRRFGALVAWAAAVLFGLFFVGSGPWLSLQREFLMLLPLSLALMVTSVFGEKVPVRAGLAIGFLMGCAATVKPHVLVGAPVLLAFVCLGASEKGGTRRGRRIASVLLSAAAGAAIPAALVLYYLVSRGAWRPMVDFFRGFAPVYASVNGWHRTMQETERGRYLLFGFLTFGAQKLWLLLGVSGACLAMTVPRPSNRRFLAALAGLVGVYTAYVVLQGRFFGYHWLLAHYFVLLMAALLLVEWSPPPWKRGALLSFLPPIALLVTAWQDLPLHADLRAQLRGEKLPPPKSGRPDQIAAFLKARLRPGDLVQPLDITGGAVHGMLLARAPLATPYLYDSFFYIRVSTPFVQELRKRFLAQMERRAPRFVVDVWGEDKPWVAGPDTTREFPELRALLERGYVPVASGLGTVIYERRAGSPPASSP